MKLLNFGALIALAGWTAATQPGDDHPHSGHSAAMTACAKACSDCQRMCDMCAAHCAGMLAQGKKDHLATLATCQDCATVCSATAQVVARGGPFAGIVGSACAEVCARCAAACAKFPADAHMKACAEECRRCEAACREMVKHAAMR
jgi:hypothetical protein